MPLTAAELIVRKSHLKVLETCTNDELKILVEIKKTPGAMQSIVDNKEMLLGVLANM